MWIVSANVAKNLESCLALIQTCSMYSGFTWGLLRHMASWAPCCQHS